MKEKTCAGCGLDFLECELDNDGLCEFCAWQKANLEEPYTVNEDPFFPPLCPDLPHSDDCECPMCRGK